MESIITGVLTAIILFFGAKFLRRFKSKPLPQNLHFKTNEDAFNFAQENNSSVLVPNQMSIGIVRNFVEDSQGKQFLVQLADSKEIIVSGINAKYESSINIGNLVYWGFVALTDDKIIDIKAVGHILAIINPEFNPNTRKWEIRKDLTK